MANEDVLNSWKEIASYLGRGVRTVQRWEQELNLPVRRPRGKSRSAVIALKTEIDVWLHQSRTTATTTIMATSVTIPPAVPQSPASTLNPASLTAARISQIHERTAALVEKIGQLLSCSNGLCERSKLLSEQLNHMMVQNAKHLDKSTRKSSGVEGVYHAIAS